jgi:hypothetical protein
MENNTKWTLEALKEHYDTVIENQDNHYNTLLEERAERTNQKFDAIQMAVTKAENATEKRFEGVNEFRAQLGDQSRTLMPRVETEVLIKNINERISDLSRKMEKNENLKSGGNAMIAYVIAGISFLITIITLLAKFGVIGNQ